MRLPAGSLPRAFTLSGLWVAGIGFFVTRFTVTLAVHESRNQFLIAGVIPLVLGLLLAAAGVALLVGSFDRSFVRSVAVWCASGTLAMAALVALTLVGSTTGPAGSGAIRSEVVLSNFLIGGALLGALTGLYAGQNVQNRAELSQQANRLVTINRLLRHEVLNAIAVIRGRAETLTGDDAAADADSAGQILNESDRIAATVEDVKHLTRSSSDGLRRVDLVGPVEACVEAIREDHPDAEVELTADVADATQVWADPQLSHALYPLVENAVVYGEPPVTVELAVGRHVACIRVTDAGPGLPEEHRATLERGTISDYDDPGAGFGTNLARLFVEGYGGDIRTDVSADGTAVEVELALATEDRPSPSAAGAMRSVGVDRRDLIVATAAALLAGGVMGVFIQAIAGVIPVIGALYGVADPLVGWITHEFHSVVFGLVFAGIVAVLPQRYAERPLAHVGVAVAWGLALWLIAAGLVMPVWLILVGLNAPIPNISMPSLGGHLLWGLVLGGVYCVGTRYLPEG